MNSNWRIKVSELNFRAEESEYRMTWFTELTDKFDIDYSFEKITIVPKDGNMVFPHFEAEITPDHSGILVFKGQFFLKIVGILFNLIWLVFPMALLYSYLTTGEKSWLVATFIGLLIATLNIYRYLSGLSFMIKEFKKLILRTLNVIDS